MIIRSDCSKAFTCAIKLLFGRLSNFLEADYISSNRNWLIFYFSTLSKRSVLESRTPVPVLTKSLGRSKKKVILYNLT